MQQLYPTFSSVPLRQLDNNRHFLAQAYALQSSLTFLVENIDDSQLMADQVAQFASTSFFLPSPSIAEQMNVSHASQWSGLVG